MPNFAQAALRRGTGVPVWCQISIKQHSNGNEAEVGAISAAHERLGTHCDLFALPIEQLTPAAFQRAQG